MEYHYILIYQQYPLEQMKLCSCLYCHCRLRPLRARACALLLSCDCPYCLIASQLLGAGFVSMTRSDPKQCPDTVLRVSVSWEVWSKGEKEKKASPSR